MTREETNEGIRAVMSIGTTIRRLGEVCVETLFDTQRQFVSRPLFDRAIEMLIADGAVSRSGSSLQWSVS